MSRLGLAIALLWLTGCAARFEAPSGEMLIIGFARIETRSNPVGKDRIVSIKTEQTAPLSVGIEPRGINASVGISGGTIGWVSPAVETNDFRECRTFGLRSSGGAMPWRWGITRFRVPRKGPKAIVCVETVRGIDLKLRTVDPAIRAGYSRSTLVQGESTNGMTWIQYQTGTVAPLIEISEEEPKK